MSGFSRVVPAPWFVDNGIGVFPIKPGSKEPACRSWDDFRCDRDVAAGFQSYGVQLTTWFGVIDTDSPENEAWVQEHCPRTPFQVQTARGLHRYYRLMTEATPKFIKRDGCTIEFRNAGQYVIGPGSKHPSGVVYTALPWTWNLDDVTIFPKDFRFDDRQQFALLGDTYEFPAECVAGERHAELFKLIRQWKALGNDFDSARQLVTLANQNRCTPPITEDSTFERWCRRAWNNPDRPIERILPKPVDPFGGDPLDL